MSKIKTILVFAAGYVIGARAGRGRYEDIKYQALKVWDKPAVQHQVDNVADQVGKVAEQAKQYLSGMPGVPSVRDSTKDPLNPPHYPTGGSHGG